MRLSKGASISGLLLFGTITSLSAKIAYEIQVDGEYFRKPWAMTTIMFIGMSLCLPLAYMNQNKKNASLEPLDTTPLLQEPGSPKHERSELKEVLLLAIPTLFDLIATVLMNVGLLYVTASVYQMMRGAEMLFAALFAVVFLRRKLNKFHYMGILACLAGITLVGLSSVFAPPKEGLKAGSRSGTRLSQTDVLFGICLIVLSQAVQAAQITFEDFFMTDMDIEPMKIVGYEGLFGVIAMFGFMLWIVTALPASLGEGLHEDIWTTFKMISRSESLVILLVVDTFALLMYNFSGMMVTGHLGAVFRTVLETVRTLFVWAVDLLLYYLLPHLGLGERWSHTSYIQLVGFAVLVTGTLVYGKGDEFAAAEEYKEHLASMEGESANPSLLGDYDPTSNEPFSFAVPIPSRPVSVPIGIATPSSLKATMTMVTGSYSQSVTRSPLTRSYGHH